MSDALPQLPHALPDALPQLADRAARPERLSSCVAQPPDRLAGGPSGLHSLLCRLTDIAERLRNSATGPESFLAELADVAHSVIDGVHEALEDLWVFVEGCQCAVEDVVEVLKPHLEPRLRLHSLDINNHLPEVDMDAGNHLQQVGELRSKRQMRLRLFPNSLAPNPYRPAG